MKKNLFFMTRVTMNVICKSIKNQCYFYSLLFLLFVFSPGIFAQVTITQTSTDDFNKGYHDNVIVSGGNVSLPSKANQTGNWLTTTFLPEALYGHKTATWKSYVYLSGGYNGTSYSDAVYKANLQGSGIGSWTALNSLPVALRDHALVVSIDYIYVFGGRTNGAPNNEIYYAALNSDGTIGSWQLSFNTLPQALWGHTAQFINGYIYVVGGTNLSGENTALNTVYYAKVGPYGDISSFTATNSLPNPRNCHSMVNYDGKLYVLGGYDNSGTKQNTVYYASVMANGTCSTWQSTTTNLTEAISNHSSTCYNGIITIIGGDPGGTLSNKVYYADINNSPNLSWNLSAHYLFNRRKDGQAFVANSQIIYAGGEYLSGLPISNTRYSSLNMSGNMVNKGTYISYPFQLFKEMNMNTLNYNITYNPTYSSYEILYRTAGDDEVWSDWYSGGQDNPLSIGQTKRYLQYMIKFSTTSNENITFDDLTLYIDGYSELSGNLNAIDTLKFEDSPFWVSGNISFTSGSHWIDPGVEIVFTENTGLEIGQANFYCNGTSSDSILFTYCTNDAGLWNGVYFNTDSDNGVISQMSYTVIEKAGYGSRNANLYCYYTNMPYVSHSVFREAVGNGIRLYESDLTIENCNLFNNTENGLYLYNSTSSLVSTDMNYNDNAGIYYSNTGSSTTSFSCNIENNYYGLYYPTPNQNFPLANNPFNINNNVMGVAIAGGDVSSDRTWNYIDVGYHLLGDVYIRKDNSKCRLTIKPGNTIKFNEGVNIQIAWKDGGYPYHNFGGELYAVGKSDSIITFTSFNGLSGGWDGLYFHYNSDWNGSTSSLNYCTIEKGNSYNIYCDQTNQPAIENCTISGSLNEGIELHSSPLDMDNCTIENNHTGMICSSSSATIDSVMIFNNSNTGIRCSGSPATISNSQIFNNNVYEIYGDNPNGYPNFTNSTITGNGSTITIGGSGTISSDRTWLFFNGDYEILGDVIIAKDNSICRLTIEPDNTLKFASGVHIQIAYYQTSYPYHNYGGELYAEASVGNEITFTSLNGTIGGWDGLYFHYNSDWNGATSSFKHCTIEKGNSYNIYCDQTNQPTIENCTISGSLNEGIELHSSPVNMDYCTIENNHTGIYSNNSLTSISNSQIQNNSVYEIYAANPNGYPVFTNSTIVTGDTSTITIGSGMQTYDRTWLYFNGDYEIIGDVTIAKDNSKCSLTINPGNTIKFDAGVQLQIGYYQTGYPYHSFGGELFAEGTAGSIITFTSTSDTIGGWDGIYFHDKSDWSGSTSSLLNCIIEKGNSYNIYCNSTAQPLSDSCIIRYSAGKGFNLNSSPISINNSTIVENHTGIYSNTSAPVITNCFIVNNTDYEIYANNPNAYPDFINSTVIGFGSSIVIGSGMQTIDKTWIYFNGDYEIIGDITVAKDNNKCRLTILPGNTIKFDAGVQLQIGYYQTGYPYHSFGGELYAEGSSALNNITFTALNGAKGNWDGIYFHDKSDWGGSTSLLKYCEIEKGSSYNIYCNSTNQPEVEYSEIQLSDGYGVNLNNSSPSFLLSKIISNTSYGFYLTGSSNPQIGNTQCMGCDLYGNGTYDIYNSTGNNIGARYNFWNNTDSIYIANRIYDYYDDPAKGIVSFSPYAYASYYNYDIMEVVVDSYTDVNCLGGSDGTINITASGGVPPYSYLWSNGDTIEDVSGLAAGYYSVIVTDINDCPAETSATLSEPPTAISLQMSSTNVSCMGCCDGTAMVVASGSVDGYSYLWDDPLAQTNDTAVGLCIGTYIVIVTDTNGCTATDSVEVINNTSGYTISGQLTYDNTSSTALNNTTVFLKDFSEDIIFTENTDALGTFCFIGLENNSYILDLHSDKQWGGGNATDALGIMKHYSGMTLLTGLREGAADVNASGYINSTDALQVMQRYTGLINSFNAGDWLLERDTVIISGANETSNMEGICYGDVNGSYVPPSLKPDPTIIINYEGLLVIESYEEFELPVRVDEKLQIGAMSLTINYPEDLDVLDVIPAEGMQDLMYNAKAGKLRIAWYNLTSVFLIDNDPVITLKLKYTANADNIIELTLDDYSEFANGDAKVIQSVVLNVPYIKVTPSTVEPISDIPEDYSLSHNYPNPFINKTEIEYTLPEPGNVKLIVFDLPGEPIEILVDKRQSAGKYKVTFNSYGLAPGIYLYKIEVRGVKTNFVQTKMMVISK
ncbi:MAG: right-handed parallel beta-helix repeat-containing protein [Bacteroidales bacterium]|nr:right-handed parallel beta-helix repeat-containing protein [Bacteroidales bacterium]